MGVISVDILKANWNFYFNTIKCRLKLARTALRNFLLCCIYVGPCRFLKDQFFPLIAEGLIFELVLQFGAPNKGIRVSNLIKKRKLLVL